ncbi:hypothetical protein AAEU32_02875 [Pseudoalteromonas sp. SSDWG2]|uniref:hypothetical protein n=1 Tax=Pseudoalteromonas sp. SSDWG2 TaxID=3139391 RepID=UPI003BA90625
MKYLLPVILTTPLLCHGKLQAEEVLEPIEQAYMDSVMLAMPPVPTDLSERNISCTLPIKDDFGKSAEQINYNEPGWVQRLDAQWDYFNIPPEEGRILVIETVQDKQGVPHYKYFANRTQSQVYEPWSSSKVMAITGALSHMRAKGNVGALAKAGDVPVVDLITSIHSYQAEGAADGNSNAIATYFANLATRGHLSSLFHDTWLKLDDPSIHFSGAYANEVFTPSNLNWQQGNEVVAAPYFLKASDDPHYQTYRCDSCALTGNKPMTTLAQAEWLKRLSMHSLEPSTAHPNLTAEDIEVLFYGHPNAIGGMSKGIGLSLHHAIARAFGNKESSEAIHWLENSSDGKWRVWQKIGWGPSETRGQSEQVLIAQVCLPHDATSRSFTIAAQVGVSGASESQVVHAGRKLESLLIRALTQLKE